LWDVGGINGLDNLLPFLKLLPPGAAFGRSLDFGFDFGEGKFSTGTAGLLAGIGLI